MQESGQFYKLYVKKTVFRETGRTVCNNKGMDVFKNGKNLQTSFIGPDSIILSLWAI